MDALTTGQRILAIDYGTVRIGLAVSDPLRIIASALDTLINNKSLKQTLLKIVQEYNIGLVVVGLPVTTRGTNSLKTNETVEFVELVRSWLQIPVMMWDERYTSVMAQQSMIDIGLKKKKRREKGRVDQIAAAIILQNFLDAKAYEHREDLNQD